MIEEIPKMKQKLKGEERRTRSSITEKTLFNLILT